VRSLYGRITGEEICKETVTVLEDLQLDREQVVLVWMVLHAW